MRYQKNMVLSACRIIPSTLNLRVRPLKALALLLRREFHLSWRARQTITWAKVYRARNWQYIHVITRRLRLRKISLLAMWPCMGQLRVRYLFAAWLASVSRCETRAPQPLWKASAITDVNI